jgi:hypothetical protein
VLQLRGRDAGTKLANFGRIKPLGSRCIQLLDDRWLGRCTRQTSCCHPHAIVTVSGCKLGNICRPNSSIVPDQGNEMYGESSYAAGFGHVEREVGRDALAQVGHSRIVARVCQKSTAAFVYTYSTEGLQLRKTHTGPRYCFGTKL